MKRLFLAVFVCAFFADIEIYASYAPQSLAGYSLQFDENETSPNIVQYGTSSKYFSSTVATGTEEGLPESVPYTYSKVSDNQANIVFTHGDGSTTTYDLNFTSALIASGTWIEAEGNDYITGTVEIVLTLSPLLSVEPLKVSASRDLVYLQTPSGPTEIDGAGEIAFELELFDQPNITNLSLTIDGQNYSLSSDQKPNGFSLEYGYSDQAKPNELFDLESASDSDWTAYADQTTFAFSLTVDGSEYSYSHNLPAESELSQPANVSFNGDYSWKQDNEGYDYIEILKNDSYQFSWDTFSTTDSNDYIVVHLQELVGDDDVEVMPEIILDAGDSSYTVDGGYLEVGKKYSFYVSLMNVTEQQTPSGFTHASGSDTSLPLLQTTARMVTVLDFVVTVDYAPTSLLGQKFRINEVGYTTYDYFFNSEDAYFWDTELATPKLRAIPYTYEKNSSKEASLSLNQDFGIVTHQVTFASALEASSTWEDNDSSGIGSIQVLSDDYAPDSLIGWTLEAGTDTSYQFTSSTDGVFYYKDDTNDSNSELSTITYNWEVAGPSMGKLTTSLDETTWLFFDSNTTGYFDWEESGADDGDSGEFTLSYYGDGNAQESLVGDSLTLGDTTYVFSSNTSVTIHTSNGTTTSEYTYLRNGSANAVLSIGSSIMELKFYSSGYGRVESGGTGYFRVLSNWETKGWVWYDHYPWAYSNNMQDWYYQVLFINDDNESDMAHYQVWDNQWNIPEELTYSGESDFSSADAYYWEDYDDFNGTELNSSKWDVGYWGGGQSVTISNGQAQLTGAIYSVSSPMQIPSDIAAAASDSTDGNTFLFFRDEDIYGIQADISIPSQNNDYEAGIYLASLDINPLGSLGAEIRHTTSGPVLLFDYLDSGNELEHQEAGSLDTFYQLQITKIDGKTSHYLNGNLIKQFDSSSHDEDYWTIGAFNDNGSSYSTIADNVRVLRKKSYPQGWMWMDYYPWAYSHESNSWLYFQLAKDTDGQPAMIYWDTAKEDWDIYYPALSPEQTADQEKASQSLNQD